MLLEQLLGWRRLRVYRDETSMEANAELTPTIRRAISMSEHFVLFASPAVARSPAWIEREVTEFLSPGPSAPLAISPRMRC